MMTLPVGITSIYRALKTMEAESHKYDQWSPKFIYPLQLVRTRCITIMQQLSIITSS